MLVNKNIFFLGAGALVIFLAAGAVLFPKITGGMALAVVLVALFWRWPEKSLYLLLAYLPWQIALNISADIDLASGRVLILLFATALFFKNRDSIKKTLFSQQDGMVIFLILILSAASVLVAQNQLWGWRKLGVFFSIFPLFFLIINLVNTPQKIKKAAGALVVGGVTAAVAALGQFFSQFIFGLEKTYVFLAEKITPLFSGEAFGRLIVQNPSWLVEVGGKNFLRAMGTFPDPHMAAFFFGIIFFLALGLALGGEKKKIFFLASFFALGAVALTFSRGGYLGLVIGLIVFLVFARPNLVLQEKKLIAAGLICVGVLLLFFGGAVLDRFFSSFNLAEGSNLGRLDIWREAMGLVKESPLIGVGLGNYPAALNFNETYRSAVTSHNLYLDILTETGLLGLIGWFWLFGAMAMSAWSVRLSLAKDVSFLGAGFLAAGAYFLTHSFFETAIFNPAVLALFVAMAGLMAGLGKRKGNPL